MRSLFAKLFLTFWLTLIVAGVLIVVVTVRARHMDRSGSGAVAWSRAWMGLQVDAVEQAYAAGGREAIDAYFARVEVETGVQLFLVSRADEVHHRPLPRDVSRYARHMRSHDHAFPPGHRFPRIVAREIALPGMGQAVLIARLPRDSWSHRPGEAALVALLVSSGVLCYVVARSLTRPIRAMQAATRRMAAGDLSVRVGASAGRRRDELAELARDFDDMAIQLEATRAAEQQLLRDVSHELRSPLARLHVALGLARTSADTETTPSLDRIELEAERLNGIIGQLLALARHHAGEEAANREPVQLDVLVAEVAADAAYEGQERQVAVETAENAPCVVTGNATLLRSAMENVVRNAVFYTADGTTVTVALRVEEGHAVFTVRDHGPGVPESALPELFRPFYRVAEARERDSGGAGLGLAIAAHAVRAHGGSMRAENAVDGGLSVEMRVPIAAPST